MNRFTRLVELRRLREEAAAQEFAKTRMKVEGIQQQISDRKQETEEARILALSHVGQSGVRLPPMMYENFYRGQATRISNLSNAERQAANEMKKTMQAWHTTRVELKQAEKMSEKTEKLQQKEQKRREDRAMDDVGILRYLRGAGESQ
jgi:flagellar export protein FliJ